MNFLLSIFKSHLPAPVIVGVKPGRGEIFLFPSDKMNTSSTANSSISTTAIVGGVSSSSSATLDDLHLISIQDRKEEAMRVLKSDLMAALNKEVKSLDEDNWMFEGPRSRIHLVSRTGGLHHKQMDITKNWSMAPRK